MKHSAQVTAVLLLIFFAAQLVGLSLIAAGTHVDLDEQGNRVVTHDETALGPRPQTQGFASFTFLIIGVAIGTVVLLILARFHLTGVWKLWFFAAVWLASTVSLGAILPRWLAVTLALVLAVWKVWRPNVVVHNVTEVLVYSGIALLLVPILNLFYAFLLLLVFAAYDAYAVWKSKHMVAMAQFQTESKLFAGLLVPYAKRPAMRGKPQLAVKPVRKPAEGKNAILGGGDIAFPMLFAGVVLDTLVQGGYSQLAALGYSLLVVAGAGLALLGLFVYAKPDRFYPAMPFIAAGCFVGYLAMWAVLFI